MTDTLSQPADWRISRRKTGRIAADMGIREPVTIKYATATDNVRTARYSGLIDGRHRITLSPAVDADTASEYVLHELSHALLNETLGDEAWRQFVLTERARAADEASMQCEQKALSLGKLLARHYRVTLPVTNEPAGGRPTRRAPDLRDGG